METPEWMPATQKGDLESFNHIVLEQQDLVYNLAYRILCDERAATQATQSVFERLYNQQKYLDQNTFQLWLYRLLVLTCREELHRRGMKTSLPTGIPTGIDEGEARLRRWLENLAPELRFVMVMVDLAGLDYIQTGEILGLPVRTVRSRLAEARSLITAQLAS